MHKANTFTAKKHRMLRANFQNSTATRQDPQSLHLLLLSRSIRAKLKRCTPFCGLCTPNISRISLRWVEESYLCVEEIRRAADEKWQSHNKVLLLLLVHSCCLLFKVVCCRYDCRGCGDGARCRCVAVEVVLTFAASRCFGRCPTEAHETVRGRWDSADGSSGSLCLSLPLSTPCFLREVMPVLAQESTRVKYSGKWG